MSQKKEKYARAMGRRVDKLEERVDKIDGTQAKHETRISEMEDDLAVYKAAMRAKAGKVARDELEARKQDRIKERERKQRRNRRLGFVLILLLAALGAIIAARAYEAERAEFAPTSTKPLAIEVDTLASVLATPEPMEDPLEAEKIEEALLAQGYFSLAVPMCYDYQDFMRTYSAAYGCPYPLALAIAEVESGFDMEAVGIYGEVGMMQLNPGPGGSYLDELEEATGMDPTTPSGNIAGGCYKLGQYMAEFQDAEKAAMAYNMGRAGAMEAWAAGITSTEYTEKVMAAVERWETTVNAWCGQ